MKKELYPKILEDLTDQISQLLMAEKIEEARSLEIAFKAAEHLRHHWKGQNVYIPGGLRFEASQKSDNILKEFSGRNYRELSRKYGVSICWIYHIIRLDRERKRKLRSGQAARKG